MITRDVVKKAVESKYQTWTKKDAAIDSIWYSLKTDRSRGDAIRGLANATTCGQIPTYQEMCSSEKLYDEVRKEVA